MVRGGSGDAYNLSGLILEQALVSPIPNALMLSFLRHSLAAQTISHGSVLEAIATYSDFNYLKTRFVYLIYFKMPFIYYLILFRGVINSKAGKAAALINFQIL